jgi:YegS/Rv2252/BmrU family lipid kinase
MPRAYLVYNPAAGRYPSWLLTERAAAVLQKYGWQIHLAKTRSGEHITQLARQAAVEGMDAFFIVGGDGSINRTLPGLIGTQTALGVLPAGTANVWAQELGLPGLSWTRWMALEESARRLAQAPVCAVDVGMSNAIPFLMWAGVGLDAFVVHRLEPRQRWEKQFAVAQYMASMVWTASRWGGIKLRVIADGTQVSGHFLLAVVSNIHLYAGGIAELSPNARLDDGLMDLWLFEGKTLGDTVQRAWDLWAGRHVQSELVHCFPFRRLTLGSDSPMFVQVDGEPEAGNGSITITVQPRALRVLIPEKTPRPLFIRNT